MTSNSTSNERTLGLQFVWWETRPGEEAGAWWGQLAGSTHRLRVVADQLETLVSKRNLDLALVELGYHLENYFVRIYELRERVMGFLIAATNDAQNVRSLKSQRRREDALMGLRIQVPTLIEPLKQLLELLDEEIKIRNTHTHEQFLNIVLDTGQDIFDPQDVLIDLQESVDARRKLERFLRKEIRRFAEVYADKVRAISEATWGFLKAADSRIRKPV
jgi:hypothetical protein